MLGHCHRWRPHTQCVLPDLKYYCLTWTCRPNMPGRSSAAKEDPFKAGSPLSLLGATGSTLGGTGKDDRIIDPAEGSPVTSPAQCHCCWRGELMGEIQSTSLYLRRQRKKVARAPMPWVEDLLKDFFQSILGNQLDSDSVEPYWMPYLQW